MVSKNQHKENQVKVICSQQIILCISLLFLAGCQTTRQAIVPVDNVNRVKVYTGDQTLPKRYKIIGRIKTENGRCVVTHEYSEQEVKQRLMDKAAHLGGNGVIIIHFDKRQTTANAILSK